MKSKEVCVDCGAPCNNRRKQEVVLCRSCWYARKSKAKAERDAVRVCSMCGGIVPAHSKPDFKIS